MIKKISLIPPLLIDKTFVNDIKTKTNILITFFAEHCTPLKNGSLLPIKPREMLSSLDSIMMNLSNLSDL